MRLFFFVSLTLLKKLVRTDCSKNVIEMRSWNTITNAKKKSLEDTGNKSTGKVTDPKDVSSMF